MILFTQCVMLVLKNNGKNSAINDDRLLNSRFNFIESIKYSFVWLGKHSYTIFTFFPKKTFLKKSFKNGINSEKIVLLLYRIALFFS